MITSFQRYLRNTAVPSCNLPTHEQSEQAERALEAAAQRREERKLQIEANRKERELKMQGNQRQNDQGMTIKQEPEDPIAIDNDYLTIEDFAINTKILLTKKYAKKKKEKSTADASVNPLAISKEAVNGVESGKPKKTKRKVKATKKNSKKQDYLNIVVKEEHGALVFNENGFPTMNKNVASIGIQTESDLPTQNDEAEELKGQKKAKRKGETVKKNAKKQKYLEMVVKEEHEEPKNACPIMEKTFESIGIQAVGGDIGMKLSDLLTTCKDLITMTGIPNFEILRRVVEAVKMVYPEKRIIANLDTRDKVIMTLTKLKHDMSYSLLSSLFKCARIAQCRNMVYNTLTKLSNVLRHAIEFPTMEELQINPPDCFEGFREVRVVLDRVEITVQRPNNLCCQLALFSHSCNYTVKFMTGFTPGGMISFVSKAYSGRSSDSRIFEQCKIVEQLSRDEAIMTSKDFTVESICSKYGVKLIRPKFCTDEADRIAKALVHIERANQQLKMFKVLSGRVPISLIKKCEDILITIAAIVNISTRYSFR